MRSNEQMEVMNCRDKGFPAVLMSTVGDGAGDGHSAAVSALQTVRRLVVIEKRPLMRECLERCLIKHVGEEVVSYASIEIFLTRLEGALPADSKPEIVVVYSVGNRFIDSATSANISRVLNCGQGVRLVVLSERDEVSQATVALEQGASGFIPMSMSLNLVSEAIRLVQAGGMYVPASSLLAANRPRDLNNLESNGGLSGLTTRQLAVLEAVRRGKANKIIAYELNMCESTVKVHLRNIMKKLRARNRTEAAFMINEAMQQGA